MNRVIFGIVCVFTLCSFSTAGQSRLFANGRQVHCHNNWQGRIAYQNNYFDNVSDLNREQAVINAIGAVGGAIIGESINAKQRKEWYTWNMIQQENFYRHQNLLRTEQHENIRVAPVILGRAQPRNVRRPMPFPNPDGSVPIALVDMMGKDTHRRVLPPLYAPHPGYGGANAGARIGSQLANSDWIYAGNTFGFYMSQGRD